MKNYTLAFDAGAKGTKYIVNKVDTTQFQEEALMFDSAEEAQSYNDENNWLCYVAEYEEEVLTYDVFFDSDTDSNNLGFNATLEYCENYIKMNNGTNHSYFADYKNGIVSIRCNENELTVFETEVI